MRSKVLAGMAFGMLAVVLTDGAGSSRATPQTGGTGAASQRRAAAEADDPVRMLVGRLDLEKYKATIKGLTQFGDRRQGTDRNRAAIDWIEAQLKSYGCTNTERIKYDYQPPAGRGGHAAGGGGRCGRGRTRRRRGGSGGQRGGGRGRAGQGGSTIFGNRGRTGVNNDPNAQTDVKLRELNSQPSTPGLREQVFCTKVGTTRPDEMYIVGGHMDGIGFGEAANDDGSGTALVMELARIFSSPDVQTERSIRFALWNNEETGSQRRPGLRRSAQGSAGQGRPARVAPLP